MDILGFQLLKNVIAMGKAQKLPLVMMVVENVPVKLMLSVISAISAPLNILDSLIVKVQF